MQPTQISRIPLGEPVPERKLQRAVLLAVTGSLCAIAHPAGAESGAC
ncbi:hypothetical protein K3N28_12675 [Glycomyces sp. TRM65418]|nr:hypothetical protein [Glycomyces sp. TRM65418]MCC3763919.1 hypothetical protein [Glycomyces sp. TRM65418]QZD53621.1 hypothetical protein K3N28_12605 [Glycomyces sp. TRM65418]